MGKSSSQETPTPGERVLASLAGRDSDRPAVVCPGGMMSAAVDEVMSDCGVAWPEAHQDEEKMVRLALAMQEATGFDNLAVPFCMTVEAEAYGAPIDLGSRSVQPRVRKAILQADGSGRLPRPDFSAGRSRVLIRTLHELRRRRPDLALIGNLVGPFSLLGMLCDPLMLLRWTRRNPALVHNYLTEISDALVKFGKMQRAAGADVICIAEPTGTGEILGGTLFAQFLLGQLQRIAAELKAAGSAVIVHICGDARAIIPELLSLRVDAVSFDSQVNLAALVHLQPSWRPMGNLNVFLLETGSPRTVGARVHKLLAAGVRVLSPACGIVPSTPVANLVAMRQAVEVHSRT